MQWLDLAATEASIACALGVQVRIGTADQPMHPSQLDPDEQTRYASLPEGPRRAEWLLGRAALRAAQPAADSGHQVLEFPSPRASLTHAGGVALAVGCDGGADGIGIDFEPWRSAIDPRAARFFLTPREQRWLRAAGQGDAGRRLLRLWTVKEALYKATPANAEFMMGDCSTADPGAAHGTAAGPRGERLRYFSVELAAGALAVAVCEEAVDVAV